MARLLELVLIYNADLSLAGGLDYLKERFRGNEPCELCRITYAGVTKKGEWRRCERDLRAPVREVYRNQLEGDLARVVGDHCPAVVAKSDEGYVLLLGPEPLRECEGSVVELQKRLLASVEQNQLVASV